MSHEELEEAFRLYRRRANQAFLLDGFLIGLLIAHALGWI